MLLLRCRKSSVMRTRFHARFHYAYALSGLNIATHSKLVGSFFNRNTIMVPCGTTLIPCKHTVSDTISSPFRAAFNLSLTVLVHYRSRNVFSFGRKSSRLHTGFHESRITQEHKLQRDNPIRVPGCHRLWPAVPGRSAWEDIVLNPCLSVQANNAYVCNTPICA